VAGFTFPCLSFIYATPSWTPQAAFISGVMDAKDALHSIRHDGDCSCYGLENGNDCEICDCGALRDYIRSGNTQDGNDPLWEAWAAHLCTISRAYPLKPVIK